MKSNNLMLALTSAAVLWCGPATLPVFAQLTFPPPMPAYQPLSDQQLDQLLGPIALYPDPLLAQLLPAATLPAQIELAERYLAGGGHPGLIDWQPWDSSVLALARYPSVLQYLENNLGWTTELGQAFLNQRQQVMESIQRLRQSAINYGNLQSTPQEQVVDDDGDIDILPTEQDIFWLPVYQPEYVYCQSGYGLRFGVACVMGPWMNGAFDWHGHRLFVWGRDQALPANWWRERSDQRGAWVARQGMQATVWRPEDHRGFATLRPEELGWINPASHALPPNHLIGDLTRSGETFHPESTLRPEATPRPATVLNSRGFAVPGVPAPSVSPAYNNAFIGGENLRVARTFSYRAQENVQTFTRPEPVYSEPVHFEPPVSRPSPVFERGGGGGSDCPRGFGLRSRH